MPESGPDDDGKEYSIEGHVYDYCIYIRDYYYTSGSPRVYAWLGTGYFLRGFACEY